MIMYASKKHKILNAVFLTVFLVYAVSPLFVHLNDPEDYPFGRGDAKPAKKMLLVDLLFKTVLGTEEAGPMEADEDYVIVKRKRAVLKRTDNVAPPATVIVSDENSKDIFVLPSVDSRNADQKTDPRQFKGFLPLFSGLSPPVA